MINMYEKFEHTVRYREPRGKRGDQTWASSTFTIQVLLVGFLFLSLLPMSGE